MAKVDIQAEVQAVNLALKADCYRVAIQARGKKLSLVATLPPQPGSTKHKPHQQRISLKLGATLAGLRRAKAKAILLADQLDRDKFTWDDWIDTSNNEPEVKTCGYWMDRLKATLWTDRPQKERDRQWKRQWLYFGLNKLPRDQPLTEEVLIGAALSTPIEKKRMRDLTVGKLSQFAKFADIAVDLSPYRAGYSPKDAKPKKIPSDDQIQNIIDEISNPGWKTIFALMACYGLRNHEAFHCRLELRDGIVVAQIPGNTKTGPRVAYPHPARWVSRWLSSWAKLQRPAITYTVNSDLGDAIGRYWRDKKAPGVPYDLRHAFAIRCHRDNVPVSIAAAWMGHSPKEHLQTYQRWISETVSRQEWGKLNSVE